MQYTYSFKFSYTILLGIGLFWLSIIHCAAQDINHIVTKIEFRKSMIAAVDDKRLTDSLYELLRNHNPKSALVLGNIGTLEALKGKHSWNPYIKLKHVKNGLNTISNAIKLEPNNLDLRFMRFTVEHYTPAFLGISIHKITDKRKMIQLIQQHQWHTKNDMVVAISRFLIEKKLCTTKEINILKPYAKI